LRVNREIRAREVRLIDTAGKQIGIVPLAQALEEAEAVRLDLVEINPNASPPVCKIMNRGKYLFQLTKKRAMVKKKQKQMQIKKLRIRPAIEEGDYQVKLRNLKRFLEEGDKVEVSLQLRRRELVRKAQRDFGTDILKRIQADVANYAEVEQKQDRQGMIVLVPKKPK
jgi:translation initiation factor IF-3